MEWGQRILQAGAAGVASAVLLDVTDTVQRIFDSVIAGAAAEVSLEPEGKVFFLLIGKAGGGHDHARGAKAALECLRIEERLLHRMQFSVVA
jgi:hypothetical protein